MTQKEILAKLNKNNKFILIGEESFFTEFVIRELRKNLVSDFEAFNFIEFEHKSEDYSDALMKIASLPMMDNKKIVHIKNFVFTEDNGVWSKKEIEDFASQMEILNKDTILVLSNNTAKNVKNNKYYKKLKDIFECLVFEKLKNEELIQFIIDRFDEELGKGAIKKDLATQIAQNSGYLHSDSKQNLYDIDNIIKKLVAFFQENGKITRADIEIIFESKEEANIFDLINAITTGNKIGAFKEYNILVQKGEPKIKMFATIGRIFSNAIKVDFLLSAGYSKETLMKELGKSIYAINSSERLARKLGRKKLMKMLEEVIETDYKMKTGQLAEEFYAEVLLIKLFDIIDNKNF